MYLYLRSSPHIAENPEEQLFFCVFAFCPHKNSV